MKSRWRLRIRARSGRCRAGGWKKSRRCGGLGPEAGPKRLVEIDTDTDETDADGSGILGEHGHTETLVELEPETASDPDLVMLIRTAEEPDLLSAEVLRLSDQADGGYARAIWVRCGR